MLLRGSFWGALGTRLGVLLEALGMLLRWSYTVLVFASDCEIVSAVAIDRQALRPPWGRRDLFYLVGGTTLTWASKQTESGTTKVAKNKKELVL